MKFILSFIIAAAVFSTGQAIKCYNCTSNSLVPVVGCNEEGNLSNEFLVTCDTGYFCNILKVTGSFSGISTIQYTRSCAVAELNTCVPFAELNGTSCFYSCNTDNCNNINTLPSLPTTGLGNTNMSMTPGTASKPEPASTPEPVATPEPHSTPEPESAPESTTKGGANTFHSNSIHTIVGALLCATVYRIFL